MFSRVFGNVYDPLETGHYGGIPSFLDGLIPLQPRNHLNIIRLRPQNSEEALKKLRQDDSSNFQVMLNMKHFSPDEIDVRTVDDFVVIHAKHEEQADEHGFISREFTRRYQLPADVERDTVRSSLSRDGLLTVTAARKSPEPLPRNERIVPITIQQPAAVEEAKKQQEQQQGDVEMK